MAKTSSDKFNLADITSKFSTEPGGRIIDLNRGLVLNMRNSTVAGAWVDTVSGQQFVLSPGASVSTVPFTGVTYLPETAVNLRGQASLNVAAASMLSYAHDFTISFWTKNLAVIPNDSNPISGSFIMSSGSYGATFCGVSTIGKIIHSVTGSVTGIGSPTTQHHRAGSTDFNIGDTWYEQMNRTNIPNIYSFRKGQSSFAGSANVSFPSWSPDEWKMVTIVNRPARNKVASTLGVMSQTSVTGDEGRLETWVDGVLVNQNPPMEGLPKGWALLFREDYDEALLSPTKGYPWFQGAGYGIFAQSDCVLYLKGNTSGGTQFYQFAMWDRDLSGIEISSLYKGTKFGVNLKFDTSWTVTPRSSLYSNQRSSLKDKTVMLRDGGATSITALLDKNENDPIGDASYYNSDSPELVEGNFQLDDEMNLSQLNEWISKDSFQGSSQPFRDEIDSTNAVDDPEFDSPNGSSVVRISIPNVGSQSTGGFAGRYFKHFTAISDDSFQQQSIGNSAGPTALGQGLNCRGSGFLYYSPKRKAWIEKRYTSSTSNIREPDANSAFYDANNIIHKSPILTYGVGTRLYSSTTGQNGSNSVMSQFSWSPQMGYYLPFEEHRNQIGYQKIGWPTSLFNAPNAPRYHGFDEETIKMGDYITAPFIVKKIVVDIPIKSYRRFRNFSDFPIIGPYNYATPPVGTSNVEAAYARYVTNKKDMDNYVFFLYRQSRTAKEKDSIEDRTTSRRFLIASASLCFYNSQAFGKAEDDLRPMNPDSLSISFKEISNSATEDRDGNKITFSTVPTHTPAFSHDWDVGREVSTEKFYQSRVQLEMLPAVCPRQFVSPSLMPFSASQNDITLLSSPFNSQYQFQSGSFLVPMNKNGSLYTTIVSNFWFGGTTNPPYWNTHIYDTAGLFGNEATPLRGVDVVANMNPALSIGARAFVNRDPFAGAFDGETFTTGALAITNWTNNSTFNQGKITTFGATNVIDTLSRLGPNYGPTSEKYQIPVDPRSVNVPTVAPGGRSIPESLVGMFLTPNLGDSIYGLSYTIYTAGPPQVSPLSQQVYSPYILMPDDELILGLDAGTFGPPDQAPNPAMTSSLKDAYRLAMADSWMQVLRGDAEIKLIGEYVRDGSPLFSSKASNSTNGIKSPVGMYQITDEFRSRTIQELSGTIFDRIMSGSAGVTGLSDGSRGIGGSLAIRRDLGSSKSANYFFKIIDESQQWFDETAFGYNSSNSSWKPNTGTFSIDSSAPRLGGDSFIFSPNHFGHASDLYGTPPNRIHILGTLKESGPATPPVNSLYVNPPGSNLVVNPGAKYDGPLDTASVDFFSVKYSSGSWAGASRNRGSSVTDRFIDRQNEDDLVVD